MGRAGEWKVFCAIWRERNIKPPLPKGGAEHSEAEGFQAACGMTGGYGKARRNPSGRLRRPPPFYKGGFSSQKFSLDFKTYLCYK